MCNNENDNLMCVDISINYDKIKDYIDNKNEINL